MSHSLYFFFIFSSLHHQRELYIGAHGRPLPTISKWRTSSEISKKKINNKTAGGNGEDASDPNDAKVRKELMGLFPWITFCNYAAKFSIIVLRSTRRAKKIKNG